MTIKYNINGLVDALGKSTSATEVTISYNGTDASIGSASISYAGVMSAADKLKLNNLETDINKPISTATQIQLNKIRKLALAGL